MNELNIRPCWICGDAANSSEHRLKRSDIARAYGNGPYRGASAPVHVLGESHRTVQGPGARTLKYSPSLCDRCNSTKSQPYDRAYDALIEWVFANETLLLRRRFINFYDVYGESFAEDQLNLYKYFAKSFGCKLADAEQPVPPDVAGLLDLTQFQTALRITFSVNEDILLLPATIRDRFIGKSGLIAWVDAQTQQRIEGYQTNEHVSWFTTNFWYNRHAEGNLGSTWVADCQHVYLGCDSPLDEPERAEFLAKMSQPDATDAF